MMSTELGTMSVDSITTKRKPLPLKSNLENPYATIVLDITVKITVGTTSRIVFRKNMVKVYWPEPFQPLIKPDQSI
jgi:hypothetical protein